MGNYLKPIQVLARLKQKMAHTKCTIVIVRTLFSMINFFVVVASLFMRLLSFLAA